MICPNDNIEMQQVKAESYYGQTAMLDQCPKCGGIWFDYFELFRAKQGQADEIESLNVEILKAPSSFENPELLCPRDRTKLARFTDLLFPKDILIARCPLCNGFWLNRGEFTKYQKFRQTLKKPEEITIVDEKLERDIARILAEHKNGTTTDVMGKLGRFLSTPIDSVTYRPLEPDKLSKKEKNALDLITNAVSLILRLFIRI